MNWKFWETPTVEGDLNDMQMKVLSRYILNQKSIIESLSNENQKLTAEVQVLREVVDELSSINNNTVNKALKIQKAIRKTSPFRKQK